MSQECVFCRKFCIAQNANAPFAKQEYDTILIQTQEFVVVPALGPLVEGHVLIITKSHFYSMGELSKPMFDEFIALKDKVRQVLVRTYGSATAFEHGSTRILEAGTSVNHAHCHLLPLGFNLVGEVSNHHNGENVSDQSVLASKATKGIPYLYVENNRREARIFDAPVGLPSQYLRRLVATKLGIPSQWDWRSHPALERVTLTVAKLERA